jgi:hypothetical protein
MINIQNLTTLTPTETELLRKHCRLSGRVCRLIRLRTFLKDEIHNKRSILKRNKYKIHPEWKFVYDKIIFMGKQNLTSLQAFPCSYRGFLDSLLFDEFHNTNIENAMLDAMHANGLEHHSLTSFYYDNFTFPIQELHDACTFDELEWALNNPADDITTFKRFRDELLTYMRDVEEILEQTSQAFHTRELRNERRRYERVCGV